MLCVLIMIYYITFLLLHYFIPTRNLINLCLSVRPRCFRCKNLRIKFKKKIQLIEETSRIRILPLLRQYWPFQSVLQGPRHFPNWLKLSFSQLYTVVHGLCSELSMHPKNGWNKTKFLIYWIEKIHLWNLFIIVVDISNHL